MIFGSDNLLLSVIIGNTTQGRLIPHYLDSRLNVRET